MLFTKPPLPFIPQTVFSEGQSTGDHARGTEGETSARTSSELDLPSCLFCLPLSAEVHTWLTEAQASYARESKGGNREYQKNTEKKEKERNRTGKEGDK